MVINWFKDFWHRLNTPPPTPKVAVKNVITSSTGPKTPIKAIRNVWKSLDPLAETPNFSPRFRQAIALSRNEACRFNHNFVGTEHILLGIVSLDQGIGADALRHLGL